MSFPEAWRHATLEPPTAWGAPLSTGLLRSTPEDFQVDEILGFAASGEGPHALLHVRKRGANTEWVARELARFAGCKPFEVGFAGLKDRHALTTQYFTVPRGRRAPEEFLAAQGGGYTVLSAAAHQRKLPRGALAGNRFEITVREFRAPPESLTEKLAGLCERGVPNYFGVQRFGRDGGNLAAVWRTAEVLAQGGALGRRGRDRDRDDRGFMLSAARSLLFNAVLAERVKQGDWHTLRAGDVAILDGRGSIFAVPEVDAGLAERCAALEVHPTGPLPGEGAELTAGEVCELESAVIARYPEAVSVIRAERLSAERRALRLRVRGLEFDYQDPVLKLRFELASGSFATTVLREIVAGVPGE